ncbi:MAG: phosphoenolpyruvate synthase [Legionellales bacterium]|nr:phosphoenolpyruvate synthase [Legionellales bacterium]
MPFTLGFSEINLTHLPEVGGKNASLGEMIQNCADHGICVPKGFATTSTAYRQFLDENHLTDKIASVLQDINTDDLSLLREASSKIKNWIEAANFPPAFEQAICQAYRALDLQPEQTVAVRSSATAEDLPDASFAGAQETFLNIHGEANLLQAIKKVFASLFTERAIAYRKHHAIDENGMAISVGVQQMIRSDSAASGVMFTLDTESGFDQVVFITAAYGLGETIVQGSVNPDEFYIHKPTLRQGKKAIISRKVGEKAIKMIYAADSGQSLAAETTCVVDVPQADRQRFCLSDNEILELANYAVLIEKHYGKAMDIEWAKDGIDQKLYIVQARPETVKAKDDHCCLEQYQLQEKAVPLTTGRSIGQKIGQGMARIIHRPEQMSNFKTGEVLIADMTDPDWEPIMKRASAIVTNRGGRTCHAAIISRELGIPAVVGCGNVTEVVTEGQSVTVSCAEGETGTIYPGLLSFKVEKTHIAELSELLVKICMNLANPEQAFTYQFIPNAGIGLARLEFIISNMIAIHPNAVLQPEKLSEDERTRMQTLTASYASPKEFYIEKLAEGVATIAAAFYPKPVIVRFSDFKSNEYANLLGGRLFEPQEENPMIGYRGGSRYVSPDFQKCYALECEAIKRVRNDKGLTNTHIMFPFVRTVAEAKRLVETTQKNGLTRGEDGLQLYMMCEIPSNAILAEDFLPYFDGYSIGSNDLTQLTLGLDRDSSLVADLFDERDEAVKALLQKAITTCRKMDKYVGICGQGPSDHLDFAIWLMEQGVTSMSLSPDSIIKTWLELAKLCKK